MLTVQEIIQTLDLHPHPIEGGYFREIYRSHAVIPVGAGLAGYASSAARSLATSIYYLLTPDTFSELHRLPTEELFHLYLGGPLQMLQLHPDGTGKEWTLGVDLSAGQRPQLVVPAGVWQGSWLQPGIEFALLGATMSPGFDYEDYERGRRDELVARYPAFAERIRRLTRI